MKKIQSILVLGLCAFLPYAYAISSEVAVSKGSTIVERQQLAILAQANQVRQARLQRFQARQDSQQPLAQITKQSLQQAQLELGEAKADNLALSQEITIAQGRLEYLQQQMHQLEVSLENTEASAGDIQDVARQANRRLDRQVIYQTDLFEVQQEKLAILHQAQRLAEQTQTLEQAWVERLTQQYQVQQQRERDKKFLTLVAQAQQLQDRLLKKLNQLNERAKKLLEAGQGGSAQALQTNRDIFITQQEIDTSQLKLAMSDLTNRIDALIVNDTPYSLSDLDDTMRKTQALLLELRSVTLQIEAKIKLLKQRETLHTQTPEKQLIANQQVKAFDKKLQQFTQQYQMYERLLHDLLIQTQNYQVTIKREREHFLSLRRDLPRIQWRQWQSVGKDFLTLKDLTWQAVHTLSRHSQLHWRSLTWGQKLVLLSMGFIWFVVWLFSRPWLQRASERLREKRQRTSTNALFIGVELLRRNAVYLAVFAALWSVLYWLNLSYRYYDFLLYIILVVIMTRCLIGVGRICLLETMGDTSGDDVRMYHHLKWVFVSGGIVFALTVLVYQLPSAYVVQNILTRLSMIFVLLLSWVLWKSRRLIPALVTHVVPGRIYLTRTVWGLAYLIPLVLFIDAVIGLFGYLQLAWQVSYYQLVLLIVVLSYVILRGLWGDFNDIVANVLIRHVRNGWLWSEVLLKPIDRLGRFLLLAIALVAVFVSFSWQSNALVLHQIELVLNYPLLSVLGAKITLLRIVEAVVLLAIFYWLVRWTREFAYRWLFARVNDKSLRNSLAIFSQYAMVALGVFVIFRVLGIGTTGISVVLGGLAVGIGFGLRDLANNFVSGVLLLIERPVRVGDYVTVGEHTGDVIHIGMRSLVLKTLDLSEVVVPNSEVFSKVFSNWTRVDSIVRASLTIVIQRTDNPFRVQAMIFDVVTAMPTIMKEPEPTIYLHDIKEGLIEFEVAYFVDLTKGYTRPKIRSEVLLAIWNRFGEVGIKPAYPQRELHFHERPGLADRVVIPPE